MPYPVSLRMTQRVNLSRLDEVEAIVVAGNTPDGPGSEALLYDLAAGRWPTATIHWRRRMLIAAAQHGRGGHRIIALILRWRRRHGGAWRYVGRCRCRRRCAARLSRTEWAPDAAPTLWGVLGLYAALRRGRRLRACGRHSGGRGISLGGYRLGFGGRDTGRGDAGEDHVRVAHEGHLVFVNVEVAHVE